MTTYYPTKDGQAVEIIKEKIQEDLQRLGSDEKTKEPKHLTFYIVKKQKHLLLAIILSKSKGLNTSIKKENSSKMRP